MNSSDIGSKAEQLAVNWLATHGFRVVDRNWRNRWCELDIVAQKNAAIHIIEVKYRRRTDFGDGFAYITPDKIRRLQRAAFMWLTARGLWGSDYQVDIIAISGQLLLENVAYLPNAIDGV